MKGTNKVTVALGKELDTFCCPTDKATFSHQYHQVSEKDKLTGGSIKQMASLSILIIDFPDTWMLALVGSLGLDAFVGGQRF